MVSVVIIDDAVNFGVFKSIDSFSYYEVSDTVKPCIPNHGHLTHATICGAIIKHYAPQIKLINLNIFSPQSAYADVNKFALALHWCALQRVDIVHLSIGSVAKSDEIRLCHPFKDALSAGCCVIASVSNTNVPTFPADFSGAISVISDPLLRDDQFYILQNKSQRVRFAASASHSLLKCDGSCFKTKNSNSFATPLITAKIACQLASFKDKSERFSLSDYFI